MRHTSRVSILVSLMLVFVASACGPAPVAVVPTPTTSPTAMREPTTQVSSRPETATPSPSLPTTASPTTSTTATAAALDPSRVLARIPVGRGPRRIAIGGGMVWVLNRTDRTVSRIDPGTNQVVGAPVRLDFDPWDMAVGEGAVWVASNGDNRVSVARIDPRTNKIVATIGGEPNVIGSFIAAGMGAVWVGNSDERAPGTGTSVSRIDPKTNQVVGAPILVGGSPQGIVVGAGAVWVAGHNSSTVIRIDPRTNQPVATIQVVSDPHGIAAGANAVWVANYHSYEVTQIDPQTNQVVGLPIRLPFAPLMLAPAETGVWVTASTVGEFNAPGDDRIARIDPRTHQVVEILRVGGGPEHIAVGEGSLWVVTHDPDLVLRLAL